MDFQWESYVLLIKYHVSLYTCIYLNFISSSSPSTAFCDLHLYNVFNCKTHKLTKKEKEMKPCFICYESMYLKFDKSSLVHSNVMDGKI